MKKIALLLMATFALAYNTKANEPTEVKNQYVKWETVPDVKKVQTVWLKDAMQGKSIAGALVRANANSYKKVWGEEKYNTVLNSDNNQFSIDYSKGGEINWALDANSNPVQSGILPAGVPLVYLGSDPIAKWGSNGCLNAVTLPPSYANDGEDPDNRKSGNSPGTGPIGYASMTNGSNSITFTGSANDALMYFKDGLSTQQASEDASAIRFMAISNNATTNAAMLAKISTANCSTCPTGSNTTATASYSAPPQMYYVATAQPVAQQASGDMNVNVRNKPNVLDYINTGANVANTIFSGVNTYRGIRFEQNRNQALRYGNGFNGNPTIRDFQGSGALGYTSSGGTSGGGLIYSGGTTGGSAGGLVYSNVFN